MENAISAKMESTGERLQSLHKHLMQTVPVVDRIACALYDRKEDILKTFINSTRIGEALRGYEFKMSNSKSLSGMAGSGDQRLLQDIPAMVKPDTQHSKWLIKEGYRSSFTVPLFSQGNFSGFVFFDSLKPNAFGKKDQEMLLLYAGLISLLISNELIAIQSITGAVGVARAFSNLRDQETGAHLERMSRYSRIIAKEIAVEKGLPDEFVEHLFLFSPLHDVGKIGIPDSVLLKPGKLTEQEWKIMRTHPTKGRELIDRIIEDFSLNNLPNSSIMRNVVEFHHEVLNGEGYPAHLKGEDIPIEARITTVADIFDALTTRRPYKEPWPVTRAFEELEKLVADSRLDADCVAALKKNAAEAEAIRDRYAETA